MAIQSNESIPLTSRDILTVAIEGGLMLIISSVAIMGNLLICFVTFTNPRFHTVSNVFVVSLAICYIFAAFLVLPTTAGTLLAGRWPFGQVLCDIQGFTFSNFIWVSLLTLTSMAASRYFKVTHMAFYNKVFNLDRSIGMIIILWVLTAALLVAQITFGRAIFRFSAEKLICYMSSSKENNQHENITNSVITMVLYTILLIVSVIAWHATRRQGSYSHSSPQLERTNTKTEIEFKILLEERRTNQVLLAMIVEVLLLWLAAIIIKLLELSTQSSSFPHQVHLATTFLWCFVPALHPFTYGILSKAFARRAIRIFHRLPRSSIRRNKVHAEQAEESV